MRKAIENILHVIIILTTAAAIGCYFIGTVDVLGGTGTKCFRFFTIDSNVIALIGSLFCLIFQNPNKRPKWVSIFQYMSTVAVTVTFLTVVFFLSPMAWIGSGKFSGALMMFEGNVFVLHFTTPVLSIAALLIQKTDNKLAKKEIFWSLLPTVLYSIVYITLVAFVKCWPDWYGFTFGGHFELAPVSAIVMYAFTLFLGWVEWKLSPLSEKRPKRKIKVSAEENTQKTDESETED